MQKVFIFKEKKEKIKKFKKYFIYKIKINIPKIIIVLCTNTLFLRDFILNLRTNTGESLFKTTYFFIYFNNK